MDDIMPSWQTPKHHYCSSQMRRATTVCSLQKGQSVVELLLLVVALWLVWHTPWSNSDLTIISYVRRITEVVSQRLDWIWNYFLLNPLVG